MKSIKTLMTLIILCFLSTPLQAITAKELQDYAVIQNDSELIEILMKYGDSKDYPILIRAMKARDYFAVFLLVEYGVEINYRPGPQPFCNNSKNVKANCQTALEIAIEAEEIPLVEYFLSKNADPTNRLQFYEESSKNPHTHTTTRTDWVTTAVYDAIILNRLDVLILFAQYGVDLNKTCYESRYSSINQRETPLQLALKHGKKDIVAFLISIGVDI